MSETPGSNDAASSQPRAPRSPLSLGRSLLTAALLSTACASPQQEDAIHSPSTTRNSSDELDSNLFVEDQRVESSEKIKETILSKEQMKQLKAHGVLKAKMVETENGPGTRLSFDSTVNALGLNGEWYYIKNGLEGAPADSSHDLIITHFDTKSVNIEVTNDPVRPRCPCTPGFITTVTVNNTDGSKAVLVIKSGHQPLPLNK